MRHKFFLVTAVIACCVCASLDSALCMRRGIPDTCSGIMVGTTEDRHAVARLGKGLYVASEGEFGGRYYIDSRRTHTLHFVTGTDAVIWELTLTRGIATPFGLKPVVASSPIDNLERGLKLGTTPSNVIRILGKPSADETIKKVRILEFNNYKTLPADEAGNSAEFSFVGNSLEKIRLYSGD